MVEVVSFGKHTLLNLNLYSINSYVFIIMCFVMVHVFLFYFSGKRICSEFQTSVESDGPVENCREHVKSGRCKVWHRSPIDDIRTSLESLIGSSFSTRDKSSVLTDVTNIPNSCSSKQSKSYGITEENTIVDTPSTHLTSVHLNRKNRSSNNLTNVNQIATDLLKRINEWTGESKYVYQNLYNFRLNNFKVCSL